MPRETSGQQRERQGGHSQKGKGPTTRGFQDGVPASHSQSVLVVAKTSAMLEREADLIGAECFWKIDPRDLGIHQAGAF